MGNKIAEANREQLMKVLSVLYPELWRVAKTAEVNDIQPVDMELMPDVLYGIASIRSGSGNGVVVLKVNNGAITQVDVNQRRLSNQNKVINAPV